MHHHDDAHWTLLARHLAGEGSAEERAAVERWLAEDPARRDELEALRRLMGAAATLPSASRIDAMWSSLSRRMRAADATTSPAGSRIAPHRPAAPTLHLHRPAPRRRIGWRATVGAIAATLLVAAGIGYAGYITVARRAAGGRGAVAAASAPREFATARGQRATIRLVDGTRVELGYASTLRVRPFDDGRRELWLEGEAVFDVVHDPKRPFVVHAANAVTEDLGTTFSVRAYPGDDAVRVVVVSGLVAMRPREAAGAPPPSAPGAGTVIRPGQMGRLDARGQLEVTAVDTTGFASWLSGRVAFDNARLDEIVAELERRYDVSIEILDRSAGAKRVTVDMPAPTLGDVLDAITIPLELRHRRIEGGGRIVLER